MKDAAVSIHRRVPCLCIFQPLPELFIFTICKLDLQPDVHLVFIRITCNKNACKPFSRLLVGMKNGSNIFSVIIPPRMPHFFICETFSPFSFLFYSLSSEKNTAQLQRRMLVLSVLKRAKRESPIKKFLIVASILHASPLYVSIVQCEKFRN